MSSGGTDNNDDLPDFNAFGTDTTIDIVTWNVLFANGPAFSDYKRSNVASIIDNIDADIIALQEFPSSQEMANLLELLPDYNGIVNPDTDGFNQNTAYIYRSETVALEDFRAIYTTDSYAFPRSPFVAEFQVSKGGPLVELTLINIHLKASSGSENEARRKLANDALEDYVSDIRSNDATEKVIVLGDFNDEIDDSTVYSAWYDFPEYYQFSTAPIFAVDGQESFYSWPSFIDHILINQALFSQNGNYIANSTETIRLHMMLTGFDAISDHNPVAAKFKFE